MANEKLAEDRRMQFRLGLNLGDAVVEQGILLGEAVNVASRLEGLSEPGGICISGSLYEQVRHLPDFGFQDLGSVKLKNIPLQVHAYSVQGTGSRRSRKRRVPWRWAAAAAVLALVAVPIVWQYIPAIPHRERQRSATRARLAAIDRRPAPREPQRRPSQEYFSDGLTNDITTDLSKFSGLFVVASNSAFTFKGKPSKVQDIGSELGVRYVLEGTVQKTPDRLRINAQLIDTTTGLPRVGGALRPRDWENFSQFRTR